MADPIAPPPGYEAAPTTAPPPGYEPVAAPGVMESFLRGAAEGATFGFDDKLGLDKDRREASRKENPWTHFFGELAGGVLPMVGTGGLGAAAKGTSLAARGARGVAAVMNPGEISTIGQALGQGVKLGAVYGGLSGAGHADVRPEDSLSTSLGKRAMGAATGSVEGAVVGPLIGAAAHGVYRGGQFLGGLKSVSEGETAGIGQGALKTAADRLGRDRITPADLMAQIEKDLPAGVDRKLIEDVVSRHIAGESALDISSSISASTGRSIPVSAVEGVIDELNLKSLGPLNIVDRAALVRPGSGDNTQMTMRAAAATPGEHLGIARENLLERQLGAGGRLQSVLDRLVGSSDYEGVAARHDATLRNAGDKAYAAAFDNEKPFDLGPLVQKYQALYDTKRGPVPEGMLKAIDSLTVQKAADQGINQFGRTYASELPLSDRESMLDMWRYARTPDKMPQTLSKWVVDTGGVKDPKGDLRSMVGGGGPRGLINNKSGRTLDDATLSAWENEFFPGRYASAARDQTVQYERPSINDFLNILDRDLRGDHVVRQSDFDALDAIRNKQDMLRDLADVGVTARTERDALKQMGFLPNGKPITIDTPPQTLKDFISARQNVKQMMDEAAVGSPLKRALTAFYNDMTNTVSAANPEWAKANALWRDGKAAQEAMEAGARMTTRLNSASRENLKEFTAARSDLKSGQAALNAARKGGDATRIATAEANIEAANARVELFKVGFARALNDMLANQGETHNLTRQLLLPGAQKMIREVLGKEADQFFKILNAEKAIHRTYSSQFGSQTTPLREAVDELNWAPRFEAAWSNLGVGKALQLAQEYAARHINTSRNVDLTKLYTETNPVKQLEALRAMQTLATRRSTMGHSVGMPVAAGAGLIPESLIGLQSAEQSPKRPVMQPFRP